VALVLEGCVAFAAAAFAVATAMVASLPKTRGSATGRGEDGGGDGQDRMGRRPRANSHGRRGAAVAEASCRNVSIWKRLAELDAPSMSLSPSLPPPGAVVTPLGGGTATDRGIATAATCGGHGTAAASHAGLPAAQSVRVCRVGSWGVGAGGAARKPPGGRWQPAPPVCTVCVRPAAVFSLLFEKEINSPWGPKEGGPEGAG